MSIGSFSRMIPAMTTPNLFQYATSELSQDAFICWLLAWADPRYKSENNALYQTGQHFLRTLLDTSKTALPRTIERVEVRKQYKNIDVLVIVNEEYAVVIEDKTSTKHHSGQLERYFDLIRTEYPVTNIVPIFFKTGDQCHYDDIKKTGYALFLRTDFLGVLAFGHEIGVESDIFRDFHHHLETIERAVGSYAELPLVNWDWSSWTGFFIELRRRLDDGDWDYVPNAAGGFMGFWWHENDSKYLQLEEKTLCFKIEVKDKSLQGQKRDDWHTVLMKQSKESTLKIVKPIRFGRGTWMTVAVLSGEYRCTDDTGRLDMDATVTLLREAEALLDMALSNTA